MTTDKLVFLGLLGTGAVLIIVGFFFPQPTWGLVLLGAGALLFIGSLMRAGGRASRHRRDRLTELHANAAQRGDVAFFVNPHDGPVL